MYFKNDTTVFDICVDKYANTSDMSDNASDKNTLICQFTYSLGTDRVERIGSLYDELLQTTDIVRLYNIISDVYDEKINAFEYADDWNYVVMKLTKHSVLSYELCISIYLEPQDEYISDVFNLSKEELGMLKRELFELTEKFPVIE